MAKLTLRAPWTSQPQSPVRIDWSNPLTRGLSYVFDGKSPSINAVNGQSLTTTVTGTVSPVAGKFGKGIYTPNGSWIDIAVGKDWQGPITIIAIANIKGLDANFGGLFAKITTGTTSQLAVGRAGSTSTFYISVNDAASATISGSSITALTNNPSVLGFSWAGGTGVDYFEGGVSKGTFTSLSAQNSGTGALRLGGSRDASGSYDSDVEWYGFFKYDRALSAQEVAAISANPWQIFQPLSRTIWVPNAGGGGPTYTLTADSASYTLTGQTTGLAFNRVLTADTQSFALTGQTTGLAFNRTLAADSGSFALTGQDAGLAFNRVLSAENGSYALDGQDVTLTYTPISGATYTLTAASGSFALTGQDTGLAFNRVLTADTQSYSLSGQTAGLAFNRVLTADTVSYALTGQDASLTYTGNTYTLNAESGTFFVDGQDANLVYSGGSSVDTGDGSMSRKRYYLRRKGKILLFDTAAQADDYLEAEEEAQKAIAAAKSRGAKKRIAAKILKAVEPVESVEIAPLQEMVKAYSVPVDLPTLLKQNDYSQVMKVREMIQRMLDDEDDELLLLLA